MAWHKQQSYVALHAIGLFSSLLGAALAFFSLWLPSPLHTISIFQYVPYFTYIGCIEMLFLTVSLADWMRTQEKRRLQAEVQAKTDALMGVLNRRGFEQRVDDLRHLVPHAQIWVASLDIDHFKSINDQYGHDAGDEVLKHIAALMQLVTRERDVLARLGGEEFVIVLIAETQDQVLRVLERLREAFEAKPTQYNRGQVAIQHTVSLGFSQYSTYDEAIFDALKRSDQASYLAKKTGRNKVVFY